MTRLLPKKKEETDYRLSLIKGLEKAIDKALKPLKQFNISENYLIMIKRAIIKSL